MKEKLKKERSKGCYPGIDGNKKVPQAETCGASKYFTILNDDILRYVCSRDNLNRTEAILFEYIYSRAKFNPKLQVRLYREQIAEAIGASKTTVTRRVSGLVKKGLLVIAPTYKKPGAVTKNKISRGANTYQICIPKDLLGIKTRKNQKTKTDNKTVKQNQNTARKVQDIDPEQPTSNPKVKSVKNTSTAYISSDLTTDKSNCVLTKSKQSSNHVLTKSDHCINIKKANINTKNNNNQPISNSVAPVSEATNIPSHFVVDLEKIKTKIKANLKEIDFLERKKAIANAELAAVQEPQSKHKILRGYTTLDSTQIRLTTANQALEQRLRQFKLQNQRQTDLSWVTSIEGPRPVSKGLCCYLNRRLAELGYDPSTPEGCSRFNEIVWSSRFGDMAVNNISKEENSMCRAFNSCLKLVRENSWDTPNGFLRFSTSHTQLSNENTCYAS